MCLRMVTVSVLVVLTVCVKLVFMTRLGMWLTSTPMAMGMLSLLCSACMTCVVSMGLLSSVEFVFFSAIPGIGYVTPMLMSVRCLLMRLLSRSVVLWKRLGLVLNSRMVRLGLFMPGLMSD